ncbi:MAG: MASE1 domain-containing protein [Thermoleophilia bacterium]|nr:MASE1 domain-containing protein [Thermoleophilia bacterium]
MRETPAEPIVRPNTIRQTLLLDFLAVVVAYAVACTVAAELSLPPFFTSVIWLPAGLAFGIVYVRGYRTLPGLFVGAILGLLTRVVDWSMPNHLAPGVTLAQTVGGVLLESVIVVGHAALGTWLVRRFVRDRSLTTTSSAALFLLLAGPVSCLVGSVLGPPAMVLRSITYPDFNGIASVAFGFFNGDGLGVLLVAPIVAYLAGPSDVWRGRGLPILLTSIATMVTLVVLHAVLMDVESRRVAQQFETGNDRYVRRAEAAIDGLSEDLDSIARARAAGLQDPTRLPDAAPWLGDVHAWSRSQLDRDSWHLLDESASSPLPDSTLADRALRTDDLAAAVAVDDQLQALVYRTVDLNGVVATASASVDLRELLLAASDGHLLDDAGVAASGGDTDEWHAVGGEHERFLVDSRIDPGAIVQPTRASTVDRATMAVGDARIRLAFGPSVRYLRQSTIFLAMIPISIASMLLAIATGTLALVLTGRAQRLEAIVAARTEQLARSEREYRSVVDSVAEVIFRIDAADVVQFVSRSWFDTVAHEPLQPEGHDITEFIDPLDHDVLHDAIDRVRAASSDLPEVVDVRVSADPGRVLQARLRHDPHDDAIVGTFVDPAPERRLAAARSQFVSLVSHEFRTPVTVIAGSIDTIEQREHDALPEIARRLLPVMRSATRRLLRLVEDLLLAARMDAGTMTFEQARVDLVGVLSTCLDVASGDVAQADLQLQADLPDAPVHVLGDGERLGQLVDNLVSNAIKFSPAGTAITVRLSTDRHAGAAVITVRDHGIGIDPADAEHLFERFWRSSAGARTASGTGLGLAICRQIADAHGGSIHVVPVGDDDGGSCFEVRLPLTDDGAAVTQPSAAP